MDTWQCPQCEMPQPATAKFCAECGARRPTCSSCGEPLPPRARFCPACGAAGEGSPTGPATVSPPAPARPAAHTAGSGARAVAAGERRLVTILFADVSGFTAMSERLDHEEVNRIMRACWVELDQAVLDYGGAVDKHIGDALMATFGAATAHEDDPLRAVQAGLALQRRLAAFAERLEAAIGIGLRMRCGIAAGEVTVDHVAESTGERSVIGPAVNLASRLEHECTVGSVFVDGEVFRATEWAIEYRAHEPRPIKGIDEPVPIYAALSERQASQRGADRPGLGALAAAVGRGAEQAILQAALEDLLRGDGGVVALVGEAGMGKSTLAAGLHDAARAAGVHWLSGRCLSYSATSPYALVREALRDLLQVDGQTPAKTVVAGLAAALTAFEAPAGGAALTRDDRQSLLARVLLAEDPADGLDHDGPASVVDALEPRARHRLTIEAITDLLRAQARRRPLVLNLEDLHWSDPESVEVAGALAAAAARERLLLLVQMRPGTDPDWLSLGHVRVVHLHPLSAGDAAVLLRSLLERTEPAVAGSQDDSEGWLTTLAERLHQAAQGNPYFLVEIVHTLLEQSQLARVNGRWTIREGPLQLPSTVRRLLLARIDALESVPRLVVQEASVTGQEFRGSMVEAISAQPDGVRPSLAVLAEREFVRRLDADGDRYEYRHALLREAAYETLSRERREAYHARVGALLESQLDLTLDAGALELVAHHFTQSNRPERGAHYALLAAEDAAAQFANQAALFWYDRAAHALERLERRSGVEALASASVRVAGAGLAAARTEPPETAVAWVRSLEGRAAVEAVLGQYAAAREHLEGALARCEAASQGQPTDLSPLAPLPASGRGAAPPSLVGKGGGRLGSAPGPALAQRVPDLCRRLARVHEAQGEYDAALTWVERGLALAGAAWDGGSERLVEIPAAPDASQVARLCLVAGLVHMRRGLYDDSSLWARRARTLAESAEGRGSVTTAAAQEMAQTYNLLGLLARLQGRPEEAEAYCRESVTRYEAIGDLAGAEKALTNLASVLQDRGDIAGALAHYRRAQELAHRVGDPVRQAAAYINMGEGLTIQGDLEAARRGYESALAILDRLGHVDGASICRMNLARVYLALADGATALALVTAAQEGFAGIGAASHEPEVLRYRALALLVLDRNEEALAPATAAMCRARELKRRLEEGQALRVLGQVHAASGEAAEAAGLFESSRLLLEEMGARYEVGLTLLEHARLLAECGVRSAECGVEERAFQATAGGATTGGERSEGRRQKAAELCARAADLFRAVGATRDVAAAEALQRALREAGAVASQELPGTRAAGARGTSGR